MSRIRSKHSKPEVLLRSVLHRLGFRFRVNVKDMPGKPDVVLRKYKAAIFVHGCFWHMHEGCKRSTIPSANRAYWKGKLEKNKANDRKNTVAIIRMGWHPYVVWECEILENPHAIAQRVSKFLTGKNSSYKLPDKKQMLFVAEKRSKYLARPNRQPKLQATEPGGEKSIK